MHVMLLHNTQQQRMYTRKTHINIKCLLCHFQTHVAIYRAYLFSISVSCLLLMFSSNKHIEYK